MSWRVNYAVNNALNLLSTLRWSTAYKRYRRRYEIAPSFRFNGEHTFLYGDGRIVLGADSYIGRHGQIKAASGCTVRVGCGCALGHYVNVFSINRLVQDFSVKPTLYRKGDVEIGDYCWVGNHVFIREGVRLGRNVVVGANSVVTRDIPAYCVAVGCPARVVREITH